ncbi:MAG: putative immunity protein [Phycicoccus sp.]
MHDRPIATGTGDFRLSVEKLRAVAAFVVRSADEVLTVVENDVSDDRRPRSAIGAARVFVDGAPRTRLQRVASLDAHRAAAQSPTERSRLAAQAAGDAASAAYLHPIAKAHQVGHILRAAATRLGSRSSTSQVTRQPSPPASTGRACGQVPTWSTSCADVRPHYPAGRDRLG